MSLDDFYLLGKDQDLLAEEYKENPLLKYRGNGIIIFSENAFFFFLSLCLNVFVLF